MQAINFSSSPVSFTSHKLPVHPATSPITPSADTFSKLKKGQVIQFQGLGDWLGKQYDDLVDKKAEEFVAKRMGCRMISDGKGPIANGAERKQLNYTTADFSNGFLPKVKFNNSTFAQSANFQGVGAEEADFSNCSLKGANFENSILNGAKFENAKLHGASFKSCDLESLENEEDLLNNYNRKKDIDGFLGFGKFMNFLTDSKFSTFSPPLRSSFKGAELAGADFTNADLRDTDFTQAKLPMADFTRADIRNADFTGARILGAIFKDARTEGAKINLEDAIEREARAGNNNVETIIKLGELLHTTGLKLNFHNAKTANQIHELLEARDSGRITQEELETTLRKHHKNALLVHHMPLGKAVPYVYDQTHQELL